MRNLLGSDLKIYTISNHLTNHIIINYNNKKLAFLVDTGADISICKESTISNNEKIVDDQITLTGITKDKVNSMGLANLELKIYEINLENQFI